MEKSASILLDARSSELEIVEFAIKDALYGINVAKVKEIIKANCDLVPIPDSHSSICGAINLRGSIIPVVDLAGHLRLKVDTDPRKNRIIITEFNGIVLGFWVTSVSRIHRISWKTVEEPSQMIQSGQGYATGIVKVQDKVIFLLDFEKVAYHINPAVHIQPPHGEEYKETNIQRALKKILVVDDSDLSLSLIVAHLQQAGYQTETAQNGESAWVKLTGAAASPDFEQVEQVYHLMVTDIEMPQMDGMHLIEKIKTDARLKRLPCIAFSSIISKEVLAKCLEIGADGAISKPEISQLVALVDSKVL